MTEDWVQEPDDVPWSEGMSWSPDADIVPFRPEESLAWRLEALRRDVVAAQQEIRLQESDGIRRLSAGFDPASVSDDRLDAAGLFVRELRRSYNRTMDNVARRALALDPACTMESRTNADGLREDIRVRLSDGRYVSSATVAAWMRDEDPAPVSTLGDSIRAATTVARSLADVLRDVAPDRESYPGEDPARVGPVCSLDPADYVALMGVLNPPPPTPDTFLAQMIRGQQGRHTPPLSGIQSGEALPGEPAGSPRPRPTARDMVHRYRDRWGRLLEVRWYSGDGDPGVYVEVTGPTPQHQARSLLPADLDLPAGATVAQVISAAKDRYVPELGVVQLCVCPYCQPPGVAPAATDVEPRLYNPPDYRYQSMFSPEESAAFLARVQERYREVSGMPWPMPGTGTDPFREPAAASGGDLERVHRMYENAAGQPFGTERVRAVDEPDVRGGHM